MTFSQSVNSAFVKFLDFNGRASRSEYWYFVLFILIVYLSIYLLGVITGDSHSLWIAILKWLAGVVFVLPIISVGVRRMHDIGKGGGWLFIWLVPLIGEIWFLILAASAGQPGSNRFGPQPL